MVWNIYVKNMKNMKNVSLSCHFGRSSISPHGKTLMLGKTIGGIEKKRRFHAASNRGCQSTRLWLSMNVPGGTIESDRHQHQ